MLRYLVHRLLVMVPTLVAISMIVFVIIQLPPGDYLSTMLAELQSQGEGAQQAKIEYLRELYGLDRPLWEQYLYWAWGLLHGDLGYSFEYDRPVATVIGDRVFLTFVISFATILFTWVVSFPIAIYSATHKYSWADHTLTFIGFLGLATPNFLLALVLLYVANVWFGTSIGGLVDPQFLDQPMSWAKFVSVLEHLWVPVVVIGTAGTAAMIRRLRANLLDELQKPYYVTAKAKGLPPWKALAKYPLRMSLEPVHRRHRQPAARVHLRLGPGLGRAVAADHRADPGARAADPGHVPRRLVPDAGIVPGRDRRAGLRSAAGLARPAHPLRRRAGAMSSAPTSGPLPQRYVDAAPFDPHDVEQLTPEQERFYTASQWRLMWWKFRRHQLAVVSAAILLLFYVAIVIVEFLAPYNVHTRNAKFIYAPPQPIHLFHDGRLIGPHRARLQLPARHGHA